MGGMSRPSDSLTLPPLFTRAFILAALATPLLNFAAFLFVHLPGFLQQLGAGEAQIGRIMAAQAVGAIMIAPFAGRAMDSRGRRVVFLAGVGLFVAAVAMYLTIRLLSPWHAWCVLDGAATTMWYTALFTHTRPISSRLNAGPRVWRSSVSLAWWRLALAPRWVR